jgi:hypothetical protein
MAFQAELKNNPCPHLRLVLETTPGAAYLTGEYICEECEQKFHGPTVKQAEVDANQQEIPLDLG